MCSRTAISLLLFVLAFQFSAQAQFDRIGSGGAMVFDGVDDLVDFGDVYRDLELPFTISAWVNLDPSTVLAAPIFTNRNCDPIYTGFRLIVNNTLISLDYGDGRGGNNPAFRRGKNATIPPIAGNWNHITAVVKGPNDIELYLNGINMGGSYSGDSSLPMDSSKPGFGSTAYFISNGVKYRYKGTIDDIRLWNRALIDSEIRADMCAKLTGNESGLIGYWDFNETSGSVVTDLSPGHHHGHVVGNPVRVRSGAPIGDRSANIYSDFPITRSFGIPSKGETAMVTKMSASVRALHLYVVDSEPSDKSGTTGANNGQYFGAFVAQQEATATFSMEIRTNSGVSCAYYIRNANDSSPWSTAATVVNRPKRIEIMPGNVKPEFDLGADLLLCNEVQHKISTGIDPGKFQISWNTNETTPDIIATHSGWYVASVKSNCAITKDSVHLTFSTSAPSMSLGDDVKLCDEKQHVISSGLDDNVYDFKWNTGANTPSVVATQSGWYVAVAVGPCNQLKDSVHVDFLQAPARFSLGSDVMTCEMLPLSLEVTNDASYEIVWENGTQDRKRIIKDFGVYWAVVSNACGVTSDTMQVKKLKIDAFIPNVITPNGDGLNDRFIVTGEPAIHTSLEVFNRWGQQVYYSPAYDNKWDGGGLPTGTYYFVVNRECDSERKGLINIVE